MAGPVNKWKNRVLSGLTNTVTVAPGAGHNLIIGVNTNNNPTSAVVSDNLGTVIYYTALPVSTGHAGSAYLNVQYAEGIPAGVTSITVTFGVSVASTVFVEEAAGLYVTANGASLDIASVIKGARSTSPSSNPATAVTPNDYVFALIGNDGTATTLGSVGGGYSQEDTITSGPTATWADQLISGTSIPAVSGTFGSICGWSAVVCAFRVVGNISQLDSENASIAGNGPGTVTGNSACSVGDLIACQFTLDNVSNALFVPSISNGIPNTAHLLSIPWTQYDASTSRIIGIAWLVAGGSSTPTLTLGGSTAYSGGQMNYLRWTGFSGTPTLDGLVQINTGTSTTPSGAFTTNGLNELVAGFSWGMGAGGSYSTSPSGWNIVTNASNGAIFSPYWQEIATPGSSTFTGGVITASQEWFTALAGFSSGPAQIPVGVIRSPGPGPNPHRIQTFVTRALATSGLTGFNSAFGGSVAGGFAHGVPQGIVGAYGGGAAGGYALGQAMQAFIGRQQFRGPGPSPDWRASFQQRTLALTAATTPYGVTAAQGGSVAGGYANAMQLGVGAAVGGSVAGGYATSGSLSIGAANGGSVAGGFASYIIVAAIGGSVAGGYATPAVETFISLGQAIEILANAGFTVSPVIIWQYSTAVPYYYIIGQLPTAGSVIPYQSKPVQLTVSAGPPPPVPAQITVPNVVGLPLTFAANAISLSMLNVGTVTYVQSSAIPPNQVTAQAPAAASTVNQYTSINLTVCSGPVVDALIGDLYTVPNVTT